MNRTAKGSIDFESSTALVRWWLALKREKFAWGIDAARLVAFLDDMRFSLVGHWDSDAQRDAYLKTRGLEQHLLAKGENIALARIEA
jgi:hypothetical protein